MATGYTNKLEDTIWCNKRSINDLAGWNPLGALTANIEFAGADYSTLSLACDNKDSFTVNNANGNGLLTYPVGLITTEETRLAGLYNGSSNANYLINGSQYWTMTPTAFSYNGGNYDLPYRLAPWVSTVDSDGHIYGIELPEQFWEDIGVRPSISLKSGTVVSAGIGTASNPYVIE